MVYLTGTTLEVLVVRVDLVLVAESWLECTLRGAPAGGQGFVTVL